MKHSTATALIRVPKINIGYTHQVQQRQEKHRDNYWNLAEIKISYFHITVKNLNHETFRASLTESDWHHLKSHLLHTSVELISGRNQDLQEGRVMPPQQIAIIMYSNTRIKPVNSALSLIKKKKSSVAWELKCPKAISR